MEEPFGAHKFRCPIDKFASNRCSRCSSFAPCITSQIDVFGIATSSDNEYHAILKKKKRKGGGYESEISHQDDKQYI